MNGYILDHKEAKLLDTAFLNMIHGIQKNPEAFIYTNEQGNNVFYTETEVRKLRTEMLTGFGFDL